MQRKNDRSVIIIRSIMIGAALLITVLAGYWFLPRFRTRSLPPALPVSESLPQSSVQPSPPPEPEQQSHPADEPENILQYSDDNEEFQELMNRRKAGYGMDKGVDMIARGDETLRIGENTVSMKEILNKIRLQKDGILEEDIGPYTGERTKADRLEKLYNGLKEAENRFRELEMKLSQIPDSETEKSLGEKLREYGELESLLSDWQSYMQTVKDMEIYRKLSESGDVRQEIRGEMEEPGRRKTAMERELGRLLGLTLSPDITKEEQKALYTALEKSEARFRELETMLKSPEGKSPSAFREMAKERAGLRNLISGYEAWKETVRKMDEYEKLAAMEEDGAREYIRQKIISLRIRRDDLEDSLMHRLLPDEPPDMYGIYVVRPGDNIWNIHFSFLKEYFQGRGISLSSAADEPLAPGRSSGVGRILKFSEKMVYIYNLRERKLEPELNTIQPLSRIAVFNMGQALDLFSRIDYDNIRQVRFDGETLWIPASQDSGSE
ncbi:MAG: PCRF domain-containing protein [Desulfococcaceae bacterium]